MKIKSFLVLAISVLLPIASTAANKPEREEWFHDLGFGMFIHWSVDSQLGAVISHSLAGASEDYIKRFYEDLPATFNPKRFDPQDWAMLARLAGMKYVVFTAKHHAGFCMWDTKTTSFNVMNTPCRKDLTKEIIEAFRSQGIAIGLYFSPEDFLYFHEHDIPIGRLQDDHHYPINNLGLMKYDKKQLKELLTNYGKIDILFLDGPAEGLKEYAWSINPDIVVTRGELETPEQEIRKSMSDRPWESCFTMGTDWQYKPTNDPHKSGTQIINMLVETRAKGGNLLLNIGPKPDGEIQIEQEALLREVALWNFANRECIYGTYPWSISKQDDIWFLATKDRKTVYAVIQSGQDWDWDYGQRKEFLLKAVKSTAGTKVSILGYDSQIVEYRKGFDAGIRFEQTGEGLLVSAVNGQRFYTNNKWKNPVVIKLENVEYASKDSSRTTRSTIDGAL